MTRPARPGDTCLIIRDYAAGGANVGKLVHCESQCHCYATMWQVLTLEPLLVPTDIRGLYTRCEKGTAFCLEKPCIIPLIDPDAVPAAVTHRSVPHA